MIVLKGQESNILIYKGQGSALSYIAVPKFRK